MSLNKNKIKANKNNKPDKEWLKPQWTPPKNDLTKLVQLKLRKIGNFWGTTSLIITKFIIYIINKVNSITERNEKHVPSQ